MNLPGLDHQALFDASPNPYLVLDRSLNIVGANRAYLESTKRELADIVGRWAWDAYPTDPETLRKSFASFERVIRTRQPDTMPLLRFDIPRPEAEGGGFEKRYWSITHIPVFNAAGEVEVVLQHPIDVTELERLRDAEKATTAGAPVQLAPRHSGIFSRAQSVYEANLALKAESDMLRKLFAQAPSFMAVLQGPEHRFELANDAYTRLVGKRRLVGLPVRKALGELQGQGFFELLDRVFTSGAPFVGHGVELRVQKAPGEPLECRWVDFVYQPIFADDGSVSGIFVEGSDVTDMKLASEKLHQRAQELRTLADNTPDILARFDRDLRHVFVNKAAERATGIKHEEFLGKTNLELGMDKDLCELWNSAIQEVFEHRRPTSIEFRVEAPEGARYHSGRFVPEFDPSGEVAYVLGVVSDRTAEKAAARTLQEAARRKDEFLATLAHELRNPLAPVRTGLHILRLSPAHGEETRKTLAMMERQISHMVRLIDDLLDVSRISRGTIELKRERLALRTVLDSAVEASRPLIDAGRHELVLHLPCDPLWLDADPTRLSQVVSNLLNNAAKYTPDGGRIDLRAERQGSEALIRVEDTGVGIPRQMLSEVFEMFTQVSRTEHSQGGLGIGLSLVKRLVEMHQGTIEADSRGPGLGASFTVRLPLAEVLAGDERAPGEEAPPGPGGLRVLVVDDNTDAADTLAMMLGLLGQETRTAYGGPEALNAAREFEPEVVFCDIGMPGMNGYEVARRLRADPGFAQCLLVALTGWGSHEDKQRSLEVGFDFHLTKPVELTDIQQLLARHPAP